MVLERRGEGGTPGVSWVSELPSSLEPPRHRSEFKGASRGTQGHVGRRPGGAGAVWTRTALGPHCLGAALPWGREIAMDRSLPKKVEAGGSRWKLHGAGLRYLPAFLASEYNDGWRE